MSEEQFTDGGVRGARVLASVRRVRREACFHRDNDRKLGGGIQGLECCELWGGLGAGEEFSRRGRSQNPNPSQNEGFGTPRVSVVLEANSGAARRGWPPAAPRVSPEGMVGWSFQFGNEERWATRLRNPQSRNDLE
jgi:hypothetical protein